MREFEQWDGFTGRLWKEGIDVRDFIQNNYTPYDGDEKFLEGPTEATDRLWGKLQELQKEERAKGGVLDMETDVVSGITAYGAAYIDDSMKDLEQVVGLQTDKPLKRAFMPYGGIKMAEQSCETYGYKPSEKLHEIFTKYHKTHNQGVFDIYTPEMLKARHNKILTGLPDTYGRGRIVGDYRRVALYGIDYLIERKKADFAATNRQGMRRGDFQLREEIADQVRALQDMKVMAQSYGYDISEPAKNAREAVQWLYFGYLAAIKTQNGAANDLLTLTLQLLRDGICYGFLIYRLSHGTMTVSGFVLALGAVSGFSSYFNEITAALSKSVLCLEQIRWLREFFDLPFPAGHTLPFRPELAEEKPLEICFSHVSFSHPGGDKRILDDVSFTLHAGEHTALVGINGAGKSTIVKLICGLYQPTEGNITINGIPLGSLNPAQYYKAIAAVFQDPFALSFSIAENVSCSPLEETDRNRCREALIRAGLWEKIASLPQKEETYLGKDMADDGITLSGGEMQKLMMARALYKNCHLLLLDEPTAALDAISENKMYETYSTLLKNKTALFISHRLASTRFCDTILFLENGKIKECGTHDELIALGGSYAHMFEVQSQYYQETEEDI